MHICCEGRHVWLLLLEGFSVYLFVYLSVCLQDTNRNLLVLDKHMKQVKEMSKEQAARVEMVGNCSRFLFLIFHYVWKDDNSTDFAQLVT